jgi:predicted deacylase
MKTNKTGLEDLFDTFAAQLKTILTDGRTVVDKETGEAVQVTPDAASLNVILNFLKHTGTTVAPGTNPVVNDIVANLPFDGSEHQERYNQ